MNDIIPGVIRFLVAMVVGGVGTWATSLGIDIDETALASALTVIFGVVFYFAGRLVELKWPNSRILGTKSTPKYSVTYTADQDPHA